MFRCIQITFLLALLSIAGCGHKLELAEEQQNLLDRTDRDSLYVAFTTWQHKVSDSGTLEGLCLNQPDTLFGVLNSKANLSEWFEKMLSKPVLDGLYVRLQGMEAHALNPVFYHQPFLKQCRSRLSAGGWEKKPIIPYDSISMWLLLSADAMLGMHHDLGNGRIAPTAFGSVYKLPPRKNSGLQKLLIHPEPHLQILQVSPDWSAYLNLQQHWMRLKMTKDTQVMAFAELKKPLKAGRPADRSMLKCVGRALMLRGFCLQKDSALWETDTFTTQQSVIVGAFQQTQGREVTGMLTNETLSAMSLSYRKILDAVAASMEKWRWMGPVKENNRIWVNLAANRLFGYRNDSLLLTMRTCSGEPRGPRYYKKLEDSRKPESKVLPPDNLETPQFRAKATHLVVNPTWFVPRNILTKEMLPEIRRNPELLIKMGYVLKNEKGEEVDPFSVDWESVTPAKIPYTLQQTGGADNSLGLVVIHFPNAYSIFMHDTPHKWAFSLAERHVSHGCVRLEKPFDLVEFLMSFNKKDRFDEVLTMAGLAPKHDKKKLEVWEKEKSIRDTARKIIKQDQYFHLDSTLPVYLVYLTAGVTEEGKLSVYKDVYRQNSRIMATMYRPISVRRAAYSGKK